VTRNKRRGAGGRFAAFGPRNPRFLVTCTRLRYAQLRPPSWSLKRLPDRQEGGALRSCQHHASGTPRSRGGTTPVRTGARGGRPPSSAAPSLLRGDARGRGLPGGARGFRPGAWPHGGHPAAGVAFGTTRREVEPCNANGPLPSARTRREPLAVREPPLRLAGHPHSIGISAPELEPKALVRARKWARGSACNRRQRRTPRAGIERRWSGRQPRGCRATPRTQLLPDRAELPGAARAT
jgi:hypothetical protein